ncbi:MAG: DICT sensory domain-containing protein [Tepidiformaceae bacterium]
MDWTYPAGAGDAGIFEIGRRLAEHLGRLPDATSFTHDTREMMRITRRVETAAVSGVLLAGFQTASKFDVEAPRYKELVSAGTRVTVWATSRPSVAMDRIEYREVEPGTSQLENQWFLVSDAPEPIAFVSWEIGDPTTFGVGGAAAAGKRFVGFVSDDRGVIDALVQALREVPGLVPPLPPSEMAEAEPTVDPRIAATIAAVGELVPPESGASSGAVVVAVGREDSEGPLRLGMAIAKAERRDLVLVDRSGEGLFASPYADQRGDDDMRPRKDALFDAMIARREGRMDTANAIEAARTLGVNAGGWFPTAAGADGLHAALCQFNGALLVVPASTRDPRIAERIRGMSLPSLERFGVPVIVAA